MLINPADGILLSQANTLNYTHNTNTLNYTSNRIHAMLIKYQPNAPNKHNQIQLMLSIRLTVVIEKKSNRTGGYRIAPMPFNSHANGLIQAISTNVA
jgi:hypothetical protein